MKEQHFSIVTDIINDCIMRIAIILFSPTGNTLKVGKMIEEQLGELNVEVQLINFTRSSKIFNENKILWI